MQVSYARTPLTRSIFLAGPTPRDANTKSWRPDALDILRAEGFDGTVFVPEDSDGSTKFSYDDQVEWELQALHSATAILFWIPRELTSMPAFTTNVEYGYFISRPNVSVGIPSVAEKCKYLHSLAKLHNKHVFGSLSSTCRNAVALTNRPFITQ